MSDEPTKDEQIKKAEITIEELNARIKAQEDKITLIEARLKGVQEKPEENEEKPYRWSN